MKFLYLFRRIVVLQCRDAKFFAPLADNVYLCGVQVVDGANRPFFGDEPVTYRPRIARIYISELKRVGYNVRSQLYLVYAVRCWIKTKKSGAWR